MSSPFSPEPSLNPFPAKSLVLCQHCEILGASAAIQPDPVLSDVIYCSICQLRFHLSTEGSKVIVLSAEAMPADIRYLI